MINIIGEIDYEMAKNFANEAKEKMGKYVEINLTTYGGCSASMLNIVATIKRLKKNGSYVKINVSGPIASSGVAIALQANKIESTNSMWMVHKCHGTMEGNLAQTQGLVSYYKWIDKVYFDIVKDILTEEQIEAFNLGQDVYFEINQDDLNKKLKEKNERKK